MAVANAACCRQRPSASTTPASRPTASGSCTDPRGWPAKPNDAVGRIQVNYVLPDMVAKAVNGMPTKRAMEWGQDQVAQAVKGQLKTSG